MSELSERAQDRLIISRGDWVWYDAEMRRVPISAWSRECIIWCWLLDQGWAWLKNLLTGK